LFKKWCQSCHLADGSGRIGPNLTDDHWRYPRTATDQGKFEIIYAGGAGAMQAFGKRLDQDAILKVMAFLDTLGQD
jgi:cytochrome c-L